MSEPNTINWSSVYREMEPGKAKPMIETFARYSAIVRHLEAIARLTEKDRHLLVEELRITTRWKANTDIIDIDAPLDSPSFIVTGWVCRAASVSDGRRQLIDLYLPGDLIGYSARPGNHARAAYVALTDVVSVDVKGLLRRVRETPELYPGIASAIGKLEAELEQRLMKQIIRIGSLQAHERIFDLMVDLHHRLELAGRVSEGSFEMPLTQETLGQLLGMSTVHVNRVVQLLRHEGAFELSHGRVKALQTPSSLSTFG